MSPEAAASTKPPQSGLVRGFDHVAIPMQNTEAMAGFYRTMGFGITENEYLVIVHFGDNMINFHRPEVWQRMPRGSLRGPEALPACGDLCFVWGGTPEQLSEALAAAGAPIEEGPIERMGARGIEASSVYTRDPDGNLVEFMIYP